MTLVNMFFFAHQPERLRPYNLRPNQLRTEANVHQDLFDDELNATVFRKVAHKCYYPATRLLLELARNMRQADKPFRLSFGLSGTFLDQAERYEPDLITIFQDLAKTGVVEFTGETYYHTLASLWDDKTEFSRQVELHATRIEQLFGRRPTVFRNTECLYNNDIARVVKELGFKGIMTEGVDWILENWRSQDFLYESVDGLPILLRNYRYSDDIGYRFPNQSWEHYPLSADTFASWCAGNTDEIINLMMDYEALGEHIWAETGIFEFIRHVPGAILKYPQLAFTTPTEAVTMLQPRGQISVGPFETISWADMERDTSAWLRNEMQQFCFEELRGMEQTVMQTENPEFIRAWRLLQTSDHLYYLCDKSLSDGDVHTYFSAYGNLFESFVRLQTAITDLKHAAMYIDAGVTISGTADSPHVANSSAKSTTTVRVSGSESVRRVSSRARTKSEAESVHEESTPSTKPKRTRTKKTEESAIEETSL